MRNTGKLAWIAAASLLHSTANAAPTANFDYVEYRAGESSDVAEGQFRNPILPGFQPDPSIVKVGRDFYLVTSTFSWFPGLPVYHSTDLVNWRQIGNAIDRPSQADFSGLGTNRGLFAPAISWHDGLFYIVNTCIECGDNFVITAKDPAGPWSEPAPLDFGGIDPSLYFDPDGRAWIVYNDEPPGPPQYEGHRAIWQRSFDPATLTVSSEPTLLVNGGVDLSTKPVWAEGPHIYKVGDWYYLMAAEGGTADAHSETIYRSRSVEGPYTPGPRNPILTQRDLPAERPERVEATGHADLVRLDDGSWWGVFLATRPFAGQSTLLGRETFLLPVTWQDDWPIFLQPGEPVPMAADKPDLPESPGTDWGRWREDFNGPLSHEWIGLRTPQMVQQVAVDRQAGKLALIAGSASTGSLDKPSFVGRRMRHHEAEYTTRVSFTPSATEDFAGLLALMDETHFVALGIEGDRIVLRRRAGAGDAERGEVLQSAPPVTGAVDLRMRFKGGRADFAYRAAGQNMWKDVATDVDVEPLASVHAGLFTGLVVGPYAYSPAQSNAD
ncbi:glycoside hydrolase family 43 protein [Altererythrobacter sp. CAU 1778]